MTRAEEIAAAEAEVATWPPLTPEQVERVAVLLRPDVEEACL